MTAHGRQRLAIWAAVSVAERLGIAVERAEIIKDSNNTIVGLNEQVVAKVATSQLPGRAEALDRELAVLRFLGPSDAPVARLVDTAPPVVHEAGGARLILLERIAVLDTRLSCAEVLRTLEHVHGCLSTYTGGLPRFLDNLATAEAIVIDRGLSPALGDDNREFMRRTADRILVLFDSMKWQDIVLHGDPWIGGNLLSTTAGTRLVDFEAVCTGPREWDLSSLGPAANDAANTDAYLLEACRALRSYVVVAWCWSQPNRAPEVDQAARWHLHLLRERFVHPGPDTGLPPKHDE